MLKLQKIRQFYSIFSRRYLLWQEIMISHLFFQPLNVGADYIKKTACILLPWFSAHADAETGRVTQDLIEYIGGQARNGVSLITIGSTPVDFSRGRDYMGCLSVTNDFDVPGLTLLGRRSPSLWCENLLRIAICRKNSRSLISGRNESFGSMGYTRHGSQRVLRDYKRGNRGCNPLISGLRPNV